jgi:uncharacterized protein
MTPPPAGPTPILYIDADACPVKDEVYRVAARYRVEVVLVSNAWVRAPAERWIRMEVVRGEPEAADEWIVEHAGPADVVITQDIPLAGACVQKGLRALSPRGRLFDESTVGEALAMRHLRTHLREVGEQTGGPPPFSKRDRSTFLQRLDQILTGIPRREKG